MPVVVLQQHSRAPGFFLPHATHETLQPIRRRAPDLHQTNSRTWFRQQPGRRSELSGSIEIEPFHQLNRYARAVFTNRRRGTTVNFQQRSGRGHRKKDHGVRNAASDGTVSILVGLRHRAARTIVRAISHDSGGSVTLIGCAPHFCRKLRQCVKPRPSLMMRFQAVSDPVVRLSRLHSQSSGFVSVRISRIDLRSSMVR